MSGKAIVEAAFRDGDRRYEGSGYYLGLLLTNGRVLIGAARRPADGVLQIEVPFQYLRQGVSPLVATTVHESTPPEAMSLLPMMVNLDTISAAWAQFE